MGAEYLTCSCYFSPSVWSRPFKQHKVCSLWITDITFSALFAVFPGSWTLPGAVACLVTGSTCLQPACILERLPLEPAETLLSLLAGFVFFTDRKDCDPGLWDILLSRWGRFVWDEMTSEKAWNALEEYPQKANSVEGCDQKSGESHRWIYSLL